MTEGPENVPSTGGHPDPGQIAAHAERRLTGAEAARLDEHLADCPTCHETFAETLRFALEDAEEPAPEGLRPVAASLSPSQAVLPFVRRPAFRLAAVLAVAASVFLAFQQLWHSRSARLASPLVAELAQAMGTTRFVEPRLTGGFQHGRLVVLRSGGSDKPQGLDAHSPAVIGAVAHIREKAEGDTSPEALGALAVTYLVSGDIAKAVKALESAAAQAPKNPRLLSDLSAAYLVRATRLDEPADIPKALEAAEKAIELEGAPDEAWFNRALALEQLHLVDSAKKAWEDFLQRDSTSPWADEARKHLEELPPAQQSTIEEDRARARAALADGPAAIHALADESPSILADYFLAELLPSWADAYLTGHPSAPPLRTQAQQVGEAIFRTTGDTLPRDAALALAAPPAGPSRDPPRTQALGYKALQEAQRHYDIAQPSCDTFRESRRLLQDGGSPFAEWARERIVAACLYPKKHPSVLAELARIETHAREKQHGRLLGRALWMTALVHSNAGDFDRALQQYRLAHEVYRSLRDPENEVSVAVRSAYVLSSSGDSRAGWRERLRALALLDALQPTRREDVLFLVALACWHDQLTRSAVHVLTEFEEVVRRRDRPDRLAYALTWRSQVRHALGQQERAAADVAAARSILNSAGDIAYADTIEALADVAEGRLLESGQPEKANACLQRAARYFERTLPSFVPTLRVDMARVLRAMGREGEAEAELDAAIRQIESQLSSGDTQQQVHFFDYAGAAPFDEMVALQLDARDDPLRALHYVERSRGWQLTATLLSHPRSNRRRTLSMTSTGPASLSLASLQTQLPAGVALLYYVVLPDRLVAWVVDQESSNAFRLTAAPEELERRVAGYAFAIESGAPVSTLSEQAAHLFDDLVRPLLPALQGRDSLVLIPDAFLRSLSFASLWNIQTGRYLVQDYRLGRSPSGSVFVQASVAEEARSKLDRTPSLLAIGNPRLAPGSGLSRLPGAEIEATEITRLYSDSELLLGAAATKGAFLAHVGRSDVVHFAGHATQGESLGTARLLLAPDRGARTGGDVRSDEIASSDLERTRLVVLAGCRTATGEASRFEGALGMTRPFLAAGVPMVVASLWDVDDASSRAFFLEFHRRFLTGGDAATSVREAQLTFIEGKDPVLGHPSKWAGFVSSGGISLRGALPAKQSGPNL